MRAPKPTPQGDSHESQCANARLAVRRRSVRPDSCAAGCPRGAPHGRSRDAAGSERGAEGAGTGDSAGTARQDETELRAGEGLGREAGRRADARAAPAAAAGDVAETDAGALGRTAEEVPDPRPADARHARPLRSWRAR